MVTVVTGIILLQHSQGVHIPDTSPIDIYANPYVYGKSSSVDKVSMNMNWQSREARVCNQFQLP